MILCKFWSRFDLRQRRNQKFLGDDQGCLSEQTVLVWPAENQCTVARVSVNFRKFSPCIARAQRARAGLTVYPPSRTLEPLAFDEYCRFDTSAFFWGIKRASKANNFNIHDFLSVISTVQYAYTQYHGTAVHVDLLNLVQRAACVRTGTRLSSRHLFASPKIFTVVLAKNKSCTIKPLAFGKLYPV